MLEIRKSEERGSSDLGWLNSRHTFSFGEYFDPDQIGFSDLLVINDDRVQAGEGFGSHSHKDMEIFSYVLSGELAHKDSMGTGSTIRPGDVQLMAAGTGVVHSEFNHSPEQSVHFLQIWIVPNHKGLRPQYQQAAFRESEKRGKLRLVISPDGEAGSLVLHQDARVYAGLFHGSEKHTLALPPSRYAYVHVACGEVKINGHCFREGDGARVREEKKLDFSHGKHAEVLVFDLVAKELPDLRRV